MVESSEKEVVSLQQLVSVQKLPENVSSDLCAGGVVLTIDLLMA